MATDNKTVIGWIVWDQTDNKPYRATNGRPRTFYGQRKVPPKIYPSKARAAAYTPGGMTQKEVMISE